MKAIIEAEAEKVAREKYSGSHICRQVFIEGAVFAVRHLHDVATSNPFLNDPQWDKLSLREIKETLEQLLRKRDAS